MTIAEIDQGWSPKLTSGCPVGRVDDTTLEPTQVVGGSTSSPTC